MNDLPTSAADEAIELPGGVLDRAGNVCRRVRLRELTGADEELLFGRDLAGSLRVTRLLARVIEAIDGFDEPLTEAQVEAMHLGDRDTLLLRLRQQTFGDAVHQVMRCPACASKVDVDFAISELPLRRLPTPQPFWRLRFDDGMTLDLRLPTGADQRAIEGLALANPAAANTRLFARLVLAVNEGPAPSEDEVRAWPTALRARIAQWLAEQAPGPDLFLDLACPECKADISYTFDLHAFFLPSAASASTS